VANHQDKVTGMASLPFDAWHRDVVWLELVLAAQILTCWLQTLLRGELAIAEPKRLRARLLHPGGRPHPPVDPSPVGRLAVGHRPCGHVHPAMALLSTPG
jgi:hypothetical protein